MTKTFFLTIFLILLLFLPNVLSITLQLPSEKEIIFEPNVQKKIQFTVGNSLPNPVDVHVQLTVPEPLDSFIDSIDKTIKIDPQSGATFGIEFTFPSSLTPGIHTVSFTAGEQPTGGGMGAVSGVSGGFKIISLTEQSLPVVGLNTNSRVVLDEPIKYLYTVRNLGKKQLQTSAKIKITHNEDILRSIDDKISSLSTLQEISIKGELNTSGLQSGIYFLEVNVEGIVAKQRIILGSPRVRYLQGFEKIKAEENNTVEVTLALDDWPEPFPVRINLQSYGLFDVAETRTLQPGENKLTFHIPVGEARSGVYRTNAVISGEGIFLRAGGKIEVAGTTLTPGTVQFESDKERIGERKIDSITKTILIVAILLVFTLGSFLLGRKFGK
jgi:hypothetical protein